MKNAYRQATSTNAKKPLWTKIVTVILVVIAIDLALALIDFSQVFITAQEPRFAQQTAVSADSSTYHYTGLGYSFDIQSTQNGDTVKVTNANFNIFGKYLCSTK